MIHQVIASQEDVEKLRQIVELQLGLLEFAGTLSSVDESDIREYFESRYEENTVEAAGWATRKGKLVEFLDEFAKHGDAEEKASFIGQLRLDVELLYDPSPRRLQARFPKDLSAWQEGAKGFFLYFYDKAWRESGFDWYLFVPPLPEESKYTRWDFIDGFTRANPELYLCSICDTSAYRTKLNTKTYTSIEHFFPKSVYPHLAMHPYNLIPICVHCNIIAGDTDIMDYCGVEDGITELLLPYRDHQPGLSQQTYAAIGVRKDQDGHPLEIKIRPAKGAAIQRQIDLFERIYHVEKRWNCVLDQIGEQAFRRIQQFLTGDVQLGNDLSDVEFIKQRLQLLMALTSKENLGKDPFGFVTMWMIHHFLKELQDGPLDPTIKKTLQDWAKEHRTSWKMLQQHFKDLQDRVSEEPPEYQRVELLPFQEA